MIDVSRCTTAFDAHAVRRRIHAYAFHHSKIDDQSVITAAESRPVMAATANCEQELLLTAEVDSVLHIRDVGAASDKPWAFVDHAVVQRTDGIVISVTWLDYTATHTLPKRRYRLLDHHAPPVLTSSSRSEAAS
jgi:hypothetical protein